MTVITVVVIAGGAGQGEIVAAGLILGILFLILGTGPWMSSIARWIPPSVIRGIQLGLALLLARSSITYLAGDPALFVTGCIIVGVFLFIGMYRNIPDLSALCIIALGCAAGAIISGITAIRVLPLPHVIIPAWGDLSSALLPLVAPQALLTVTNAILATSFLTCDLFSQEVKPERLTRTIGLMNLTTVPLGGFPICHGAGGLVGHYRYGARTGAACLFAGGILCVAAILFGSREFLELIAVGLFGALLIFVAVELGRFGMKTDSYLVTGVIALFALAGQITTGFLVGMIVAYLMRRARRADNALPQEQIK